MKNLKTIVVEKDDKDFFIKLCKKHSLTQNVMFKKIISKIKKKVEGDTSTF